MRKVIAHLIVTLDGVVGFNVVAEEVAKLRDAEVLADFSARVAAEDAMLLGRVTYQEWADYWPTSNVEPFASHINRVSKYVVSKSLRAAPWGRSGSATILKGDLSLEINALKRQPGMSIGVHGSPTLVDSLLQADLLNELRLEIYPVIAGTGARLFHEWRPTKHLRLTDAKIAQNGVAILTYALAGIELVRERGHWADG